MHLTLSPKAFDEILMSECGKSRSQIDLHDEIGFESLILYGLATEIAGLSDQPHASRLYIDTLFTTFCLALLRRCTKENVVPTLSQDAGGARTGGMAGWRLRQVLDYMNANKARDIQLPELTSVSGLSRAHFFRAFRQATDMTPVRYLERLRIEDARGALDRGESLEEAAKNAGFSGTAALNQSFRRVMNMTPTQYRRWYR